MKTVPFSYAIIRYVHDPAAGESLNVGVVLYSASSKYIACRIEQRYERLSSCFRGFDGDHYRACIKALSDAVRRIADNADDSKRFLPGTVQIPRDLLELSSSILPDPDLSLRISKPLVGVTNNIEAELGTLFERMILSQVPDKEKTERRTDSEVWKVYSNHLQVITSHLQPRKFGTSNFQLEFEHTYKNGVWHILQPVSMDYAKSESIQRKAATWLGNSVALKEDPDVGKVYLLLGEPHLKQHKRAYENAKDLLRKVPIPHEIVEEKEAPAFADHLLSSMRSHGVIRGNPN